MTILSYLNAKTAYNMVIESEFRPDNELHHALRAGCAQLCTNISIFNSIYSYRIVFFLDLRSHTKKVCLPQSGPRTNLHKSMPNQ